VRLAFAVVQPSVAADAVDAEPDELERGLTVRVDLGQGSFEGGLGDGVPVGHGRAFNSRVPRALGHWQGMFLNAPFWANIREPDHRIRMVSALARRQPTEATMSKASLTLAAACLALMSVGASAQEPTYEGRGYGGPLGVGPNFQQGGQWGAPIYGSGAREHSSTTERYSAPQHIDRAQRRRNDDDDVKTAKKTPSHEESKEAKSQSENSSIVTLGPDHDKSTPVTEQKQADVAKSDPSKTSSENSTIASVASSTTANADPVKGQLSKRVDTDASGNTVATCKRYFPTVGQTITVPCD
jgi:hypothetical protein